MRNPCRTVAALAFSLALVDSCASWQHGGAAPGALARETLAALDVAYTRWYEVEAHGATTRADLDRLADAEKTWEQWIGRIARLSALADAAAPENVRAAVQALDTDLAQARAWLAVIGVLGPKGAP